jgi:hypothetical protein
MLETISIGHIFLAKPLVKLDQHYHCVCSTGSGGVLEDFIDYQAEVLVISI